MHVTPVCKYYFDFDLVFHNHFISATAFGWGGCMASIFLMRGYAPVHLCKCSIKVR